MAQIVEAMPTVLPLNASKRRILVLDNDDSFTYNLTHLIGTCGGAPEVYSRERVGSALAQDQFDLASEFDGVLLGPGHGRPEVSAQTLQRLLARRPELPVLGVCLGHQAIGLLLGALVTRSPHPQHGVRTLVSHDGKHIFRDVVTPLWVTRYNSLTISREHLPASIEITAQLPDGEIMGIRHKQLSIQGIQFHPESILSENGHQLFSNWLEAL